MPQDEIYSNSRILKFLSYIGHPHREIGIPHKIHCPFHSDQHESAKVFPNTDTVHCFTCNETWTVESAYARYFGKDMRDSRRICYQLWPVRINSFWYNGTVTISSVLMPKPQECIDLVDTLSVALFRKKIDADKQKKYGEILQLCRDQANDHPREVLDKLVVLTSEIMEK